MQRTGGIARLLCRGALGVAAVLLLGGCGGSGGDGSADPTFEPVERVPPADADLTRDQVHDAVGRGLDDADMGASAEQVDCFTDSLLDEVGIERLDALGLPDADPLSNAVLTVMATDIDDAAAYFTPFFDCLDAETWVREAVEEDAADRSKAVQDCVVAAVVGDREVRVVYLLGTPEGSEPSEAMEQMTTPLLVEALQIEDDCAERS